MLSSAKPDPTAEGTHIRARYHLYLYGFWNTSLAVPLSNAFLDAMDDTLDIMIIDGEPKEVINFHKVAIQIKALTDQVQASTEQVRDIRQTLPSTIERLLGVIENLQQRVEVLEETLVRMR